MGKVRARRGGRGGRQRSVDGHKKSIRHLGTLQNRLPFQEVLSEEELDRIHDISMRILEEIGIAFRDRTALQHWRDAGVNVEGDLVFPDREMVMALDEFVARRKTEIPPSIT